MLTSAAFGLKATERTDLRHERAQVRVFPFLDAAMGDAKHRERIEARLSKRGRSRTRAGKLTGDARIEIEEALLGGRYGGRIVVWWIVIAAP